MNSRRPHRIARSWLGQLSVWLAPLFEQVRSRFAVDTRSLAALRIGLGVTLLVDLLHRAGSIDLFYTDRGLYPLTAYGSTYSQYTGTSLHALSGELWFQQFLFLVVGLFAVAFVLGYRTRLTGIVSVVFLISLQARNPAVLNGGDRLLRVLLLVALITPLGERWSIDALRRGTARTTIASFGTVAVLLQPIVVFSSNAILKHRGETWYAGDALEIAFRNDMMTILLGDYLVEYTSLLTVLNYAWVTLLAGSVVFLLVPTGRLRAAVALAYMGAFAGMILTMTVGIFPLALIAAVMPFLTAPFWDAVGRRLTPWVDRLPTADQLGPLGRPPLERRVLASIRDRGHSSAVTYATAYAKSLVTVIGLLVVVWMLVFAGADVYEYDLPDEIDSPHLDQQSWGLYAPNPTEGYSWYVLKAGVGTDRVVVDLPGTAARIDRPPDVASTYETFRHRKYMQRVRRSGEDDTSDTIAQAYADWACRQVAESHPAYAERVTLYEIYQPSPLDGDFEDPDDEMIFQQDCPAG